MTNKTPKQFGVLLIAVYHQGLQTYPQLVKVVWSVEGEHIENKDIRRQGKNKKQHKTNGIMRHFHPA